MPGVKRLRVKTCDGCMCFEASSLSNMTKHMYVATARVCLAPRWNEWSSSSMVAWPTVSKNDLSSVARQWYRHVDTGDEDGIHRRPAPPRTYITVRWLWHSLARSPSQESRPWHYIYPPFLSSRVANLAHKLASFSPLYPHGLVVCFLVAARAASSLHRANAACIKRQQ
jgi:hypothetical protein